MTNSSLSDERVTIAVINYNGEAVIGNCIESILKTRYANFEILVIDNASSDSSLKVIEGLKGKSPVRMTLVRNQENLQYARACNQALKLCSSKYVAILNNDVVVDPDWLTPVMQAFRDDKGLAVCQPVIYKCYTNRGLVIRSNELDSAGSYISNYGLLVHRGYNELPLSHLDERLDYVFAVKGAAMVLDKRKVLEVGGVDEDFIAFNEEGDLCWRIWLAGYKVACVLNSYVYHMGSHSYKSLGYKGRRLWAYLAGRNYIMMVAKNIEPKDFMLLARLIVLLFLFGVGLIFKDTNSGVALLKGVFSTLKLSRKIAMKRKVIQSFRRVQNSVIFDSLSRKKNLRLYLQSLRSWRQA